MIIEYKQVGPFGENTYLLACSQTAQAALVDPGGDEAWVQSQLQAHGLELRYFMLTHGHLDHVGGLSAAVRKWPAARIVMHPAEQPVYDSVPMQSAMFGLRMEPPPTLSEAKNARFVRDGELLELGALRFEVLHVPGHSPGHVVYLEQQHGVLFSGDLLFAGSVGRTDLPGGDAAQMRQSLARVCSLSPTLRVLSGHGPETTLGEELASNPFLRHL
ncbi:MAG: MBL fold metallo-hydrolase [Myxococcota bacterium]|jgi:hydroxyacylglutathione hydrolase|nr:MBL fold metallo-hydrolase [Myxococcota bacterium]